MNVFSRYPRPTRIEHSPLTVTDEDSAALASHAVGDVPAALLQRFAEKAVTTWGSVDDLRYYLPQILEQTDDAEAIAHKLVYAGWRTWPSDERAAVQAWLFARAATPAEARAIGILELDARPFVAKLLADLPAVTALLGEYASAIYRARRFDGLPVAFDAILHDAALRARLEARFLIADGDEARDLGAALELLDWIAA